MRSLLFLAAAATLTAGVTEPRPGFVLAADGSVREVRGAAGSFVLGDADAGGARRVASSGSLTVIKLADSVRVAPGVAFDAPAGDALFGFSLDGRTAFAYFPPAAAFARITPTALDALPVNAALVAGEVVALAGGEDGLDVYVRRPGGLHALRVRLSDGAIEGDVALGIDARIGVALAGGRFVYVDESRIVVREVDGGERSVVLDGPVSALAVMGDGWVHARAGGMSVAVRVLRDAIAPFFVPEAPQ